MHSGLVEQVNQKKLNETLDYYIRECNISDIAEYQSDLYCLMLESLSSSYDDQCININVKIEQLKQYLSNDQAKVFAAFHDAKMIGFLWAYQVVFLDKSRLHISQYAVHENYRSMQIGRHLLRAVEDHARSIGIDTLELVVSEKNQTAKDIYQHFQFVNERIIMRKYLGKHYD